MNIIDKIYYSLQKDASPVTKIFTALVFLILGFAGFFLANDEVVQNLGALAMIFFGIASLFSVHIFLSQWNIDDDRFPYGIRKYIIIILQMSGFILILIAASLRFF